MAIPPDNGLPRTHYPFRQTLTFLLRKIILLNAVPVLNRALAAEMKGIDGATIPQFSDASVTEGDLLGISEPTICVVPAGSMDTGDAAGDYLATFCTQFRLKVPAVADNAPEDYTLLFAIAEDTLRDTFNSLTNLSIPAVNPETGNSMLSGASFTACMIISCGPAQWPVLSAEKMQRTAGLSFTHVAQINYSLRRPGTVGGTGSNA